MRFHQSLNVGYAMRQIAPIMNIADIAINTSSSAFDFFFGFFDCSAVFEDFEVFKDSDDSEDSKKTLQRHHRHFGALQRSVLPIRFRYAAVSRYCLPSRFLAILTTPKSTNAAAQMVAAIQAT
ncbi:MAG: hypothetical protein E7D96_08095 [Bifidobacterium pseudocatenulatum]|nr:hypothetical protein [Bifidobacterium pseudocatenulatum]